MKKYGLLLIIFFLFFTDNAVYAASYLRSPSGLQSTNSYNIAIVLDNNPCPDLPFFGSFLGMQLSLNRFDDYGSTPNGLLSPLFNSLNYNYTFNYDIDRNITNVALDCVYSDLNMRAVTVFEGIHANNAVDESYKNPIFYLVNIVTPVVNNNIWSGGSLFGTSTNMAATVASGVVDTGGNLWPLFSLLGIILAFIIANKIVVFIKQATKERDREDKYYYDLSMAKDTDAQIKLTEKFRRGE